MTIRDVTEWIYTMTRCEVGQQKADFRSMHYTLPFKSVSCHLDKQQQQLNNNKIWP